MKIQIRKHDIDVGNRGCTTSCPVARAIKRVTDKPVDVIGTYAKIGDKKVDLPYVVMKFIHEYDFEFNVQPLEFELEIEDV